MFDFKNRGIVDYIYPLLERSTQIDPYFVFPYIFGGVYVLMDTGEIGSAMRLLIRGKYANPDRWEFPFYLGWIYWLYLNDSEKTYELLLEAVTKEQCPQFVFNIVADMSKQADRYSFTETYLKGLMESTDNKEIKKQISEILQAMQN